MAKSIRTVHVGSLSPLRRTLSNFLRLNELIARQWGWKDVPWWYNERASLSILAASVWKSGGIAFEEYSTEKRFRKRSFYRGRNDLYIKIGRREYIVEAKFSFVRCSERGTGEIKAIKAQMKRAIKDVRINKPYGARRIALVFVIPWLKAKSKPSADDRIHSWLAKIKTIRTTAKAWTFPSQSRQRELTEDKKNWYPGIAVLLNLVH